MTNQEINEAVAKKLGWKWCDYTTLKGFEKGYWSNPNNSDPLPYVPDYCGSIAAAWEIVEFAKGYIDLIRQSDGNWICYIDGLAGIGSGNTAPMAICLAFLKLP